MKVESINELFDEIHTLDVDSVIADLSAMSNKNFKKLAIAVSAELKKRKEKK